jgi:tetratricopeptide (TPR) repeat protein
VQGQAPADSIPMLVDQLTVALLREVLPQGTERNAARLSQSMTSSLPALKAYLAGEQKFRRARPQDAVGDFARAIELDSTFAFALYRLALAEGWTVSPHFLGVEGRDYTGEAARHAERLAPRDAALVRALTLLNPGLVQALDTLTALTNRYPDDSEVWFLLGDALFHLGGAALQPPDAFRDALDRSIRLDSGFAPAYLHLAEDAFDRLDTAMVRRISASLRSIDPSSPKAVGISLAYDLAWADGVGRTLARRALDTMSTLALLTAKHAMNATPELSDPAMAAAHVLATQDRHPRQNQAQGYVGKAWVHFSRGQLRAGREMFLKGMQLFGAPEWYLESFGLQLIQYAYLVGVPDSVGVRKSYDLTKAGADTLADPEWMGRLAAMYGEWDQVERWRSLMDHQMLVAQKEGDSLALRGYQQDARILDALLEDKGRNGESVMREMQQASRTYPLNLNWSTNEPLLRLEIARRHASAGNLREAERYLASINFLSAGWPLVRGAVEFQRAQIAERLGQTEKARALYGRVADGLRDCDPELHPFLLESRRALQRISRVASR